MSKDAKKKNDLIMNSHSLTEKVETIFANTNQGLKEMRQALIEVKQRATIDRKEAQHGLQQCSLSV